MKQLMKKAPNLYTISKLTSVVSGTTQIEHYGEWMPARPMGFYSIGNRLKCAWLASTGQVDLVKWPGDQ